MNKKKTIISIAIYLACLAVVICVFLFYTTSQSNKTKTTCYIATKDITAGTVVDTNLVTSSFKQETIHTSSKELAESYQSSVIVEASSVINKQTVGFIPKGTILTDRMFQSINDVVEYPDFDNPQYITLPVSTESMPAEGFVKDSKVSIVGLLSMADLSSTELADKTAETWVGILTNKALVYSTITDETKTVTNVILVVEKDVYPTLLISANNAKIFYLKGVVNDISEVQSDVIKTIYESTGLTTIEQDFKLLANDTTANRTNYKLTFTENYEEELTQLNIIYIGEGNSLNIAWNGSPTRAFVKHYNLTDGGKGAFYGSYSYASTDSQKKINYDANLEEHFFAVQFDKEGYYEIAFYNQDNSYVGKTTFVIESKNYSWRMVDNNDESTDVTKIDSGSIKVGMKEEEKDGVIHVVPEYSLTSQEYEITCKMVKEYFKNVEPLKNYIETIQFTSTSEGKNIYTTDYVIDVSNTIGYFLGKEIENVNIIYTTDGVEASIPLYYLVPDAGVDYAATSEQIVNLRKYLNATIEDAEIKEKYTYSELENLLNQLESIKDYLVEEEDENRKYTILSYLLRFVLVKQDMTKDEFTNLHNELYINHENGIPTKNPNASLQIELKLKDSNESFRLDLDFIAKFPLTQVGENPSEERPSETPTPSDTPEEPAETPTPENGGTN